MRHVVFIAPFPAETTLRFMRATRGLAGVRLTAVVHTPPRGSDRRLFHDLVRVGDPLDVRQLGAAVERLTRRHGRPHRILGILEPLQLAFAKLREHFGVPGLTVAQAALFRDKAKMKDALRAADLPVARHRLLSAPAEGHAFADDVGFPLVLKPPAGQGCKATWRVDSPAALSAALAAARPSPQSPTLAEEWLTGRERSAESLVVGGRVAWTGATRYHPGPLEVVEQPWIQWVVVAPREPAISLRAAPLAARAIDALGLDAGLTHMEWFERDDGSLAIGEIAARPPGAQIVRLHSLTHGTSFYRAWARAQIDSVAEGPLERRHAAACSFLRGAGQGRVLAVEGVTDAHRALARLAADAGTTVDDLIPEAHLPRIGAPKSSSYEGDGYIIARHPDTAVVERAMDHVLAHVRVRYG